MRKLILADYFFATLAVGIVFGFPVWGTGYLGFS
jgi:hypothetical protein